MDLLDQGDQIRFSSEVWAMFERYVEFREVYGDRLVLVENETRLVDDRWAGTVDRVFDYTNEKGETEHWMVDLKTSNSLHESYWLQLSAYAHSYENLFQKKIDRVGILWLKSKTRTLRPASFSGEGWQLKFCDVPHKEKFRIFENVYNLWMEVNGSLKPRHRVYQLSHKI